MKKKAKVSSIVLLTTALVMSSGYSVNFNTKGAYAQSVSGSVHQEKLVFFSNGDLKETVNFVNNSNKDESLKEEKEQIKDGKLLIDSKQIKNGIVNFPDNLDGVTSLAYPVEAVKKDESIKKGLQNAIQLGKRVYLYGGVTYDEYRELLGLDEISVTLTSDTGVKYNITHGGRDKAATEKGPLKKKSNKLLTEKEDKYDIIGYTLDGNAKHRLFASTIAVYEEKKKSIPTEAHYMREILDNLSYVIDQSAQETTTKSSIGFMKLNKAYAAGNNVIVATAPQRYSASAYDGGVLAGKTITDWTLEQNKDETVSNYDFFLVKDNTQIYDYNGYWSKELLTDHDIPYDSDYIQDWGPSDSSSSPYTIQIGFPWAVSFQFSMSSDPDVDEQGSLDLDYARWNTSVVLFDMNGDVFKAWTGWKSSGTFASMDIRETANFMSSEGLLMESSIKIDVDYDY